MSEEFLDAVDKYGVKGKPKGWKPECFNKPETKIICPQCGVETLKNSYSETEGIFVDEYVCNKVDHKLSLKVRRKI